VGATLGADAFLLRGNHRNKNKHSYFKQYYLKEIAIAKKTLGAPLRISFRNSMISFRNLMISFRNQSISF